MSTATKGPRKIIIVKKAANHAHPHHGGSWKVAYADFVTAMMAFFLVMWIVGMDDKAKDSIQGYFSNPVGFKKGFGSGASPMGSGNTPIAGRRESAIRAPARVAEEAAMESARQRLMESLRSADLKGLEGHYDISITHEGLRIEFGEGLIGDATFASGSAVMTDPMLRAIAILGAEIAPLPNTVIIEGHTDAVPLRRPGGYSNWELSSDRANAARRALQQQGVSGDRVVSVRGFADRALKIPDFPADPRNRRISMLLPFRTPEYIDAATDSATAAANAAVTATTPLIPSIAPATSVLPPMTAATATPASSTVPAAGGSVPDSRRP